MIHYLDKKSKNSRVCHAPCGFVAAVEMKSDYTTKQPDTFTSSEIGITCSMCVSALVGRHQSAIIILQSQNFDSYVRRSKDPMKMTVKEMLA
jgi:hypothetical protein